MPEPAGYAAKMRAEQGPSLRERTREAVRAQVRLAALDLFAEQGFDATTAEQISRTVGISVRSFYRYFPTKEDVLIGQNAEMGGLIRDALAARPTDEGIWTALRSSLDLLVASFSAEPERGLTYMRVIMSTTSLRAHHAEKHILWEQLLAPVVEARLAAAGDANPLRARTLAHTAIACLDLTFAEWSASNGTLDLATLLDDIFTQVADI